MLRKANYIRQIPLACTSSLGSLLIEIINMVRIVEQRSSEKTQIFERYEEGWKMDVINLLINGTDLDYFVKATSLQ